MSKMVRMDQHCDYVEQGDSDSGTKTAKKPFYQFSRYEKKDL